MLRLKKDIFNHGIAVASRVSHVLPACSARASTPLAAAERLSTIHWENALGGYLGGKIIAAKTHYIDI